MKLTKGETQVPHIVNLPKTRKRTSKKIDNFELMGLFTLAVLVTALVKIVPASGSDEETMLIMGAFLSILVTMPAFSWLVHKITGSIKRAHLVLWANIVVLGFMSCINLIVLLLS
ncbi:MAG: hypothetical protein P8J32_01935 [bacterium]|jgi:hypothetical protein|nr:hypothetical protein [bacterium]